MKNDNTAPRPRGRPRAFNREEALKAAMETFWRLGYEGASIADLTIAMGITPQSLYAAFSSKMSLYQESLAWYMTHIGSFVSRALEEPDIITAFKRLLTETAREFCFSEHPRGCMISASVLTCAVENTSVAEYVADLRKSSLDLYRARIKQGIAEEQLQRKTDLESLARFIAAVIQGMSIQAQDGATESQLMGIAELASAEIARHRAG